MTYYPVSTPYNIFYDTDGSPLERGYIYIGEANQNPITNPITVTWDSAGLYPAAQPIRTIGGYPDRNGNPGIVYVNAGAFEDYSINVRDRHWRLVYSAMSARSMFDFVGGNSVETINDLRSINGYDQPIFIRGHITIGDGGQGNFEWFDGSAPGTYVDNDGTIIVPSGGDGSGAWIRQFSGVVNVRWFGATGDGSTDDTSAIQGAIEYAFSEGLDIEFGSYGNFFITSTILMPQRPSSPNIYTGIVIDGNHSKITTTGNLTIFASGYDNAGTLTSSAYEVNDAYPSFGIVIQNLDLIGDGTATNPAIAINSYHQGCKLLNINSKAYDYFLYAQNCYYMRFDSCLTTGTKQAGVARFVFKNNNNLMSFRNLVAVSANIGYKFVGLVDACEFHNNSIEGQDIGLDFTGEVRSISIENNYIESFTDTAIKFESSVYTAKIDNNYVNNTGGGYLIDYLPSARNNIIIGQGNDFTSITDAALFKTIDNTNGYNAITLNRPPSFAFSNADFLADNTNFSSELIYNKILNQEGLRAKAVNVYAEGFYAGRFSDGYTRSNGFEWVDTTSATLQLDTLFVPSTTDRIYVNLKISASGLYYYAGDLVNHGNTWYFYEFDGVTGMVLSTNLNVTIVGGYVQINGTLPATVTNCVGEARLI